MKKSLLFVSVVLLITCSQINKKMIVNGTIKGLQKGTIYLQHVEDTKYVTLDSLIINSTESFELGCNLEEAEMLFLSLSEDINADRISFFSSEETKINTTLKRFKFDAEIEGGVQQELLESYYKNMTRFNNQKLDLIKDKIIAQKESDQELVKGIQSKLDNALKRSYLYSINFAINNKNSEVAPYLAVAELYDANVKYLDTINSVLQENIANSKYGIILDAHESQGFAIEEALSCNVPLLVWNVSSMSQEEGGNYQHIPATSIPYWDKRCGENFYQPWFGTFNEIILIWIFPFIFKISQ